ncbi:hypothetical protein [Halobaculum lipolyticum]|uniref:Uncharacterized protein n=1 Tax=Halobaculum lipolyticum TaxID=3032001 RepID=A0ABD5WCJ2_9EURY|nr:hypothetical protein [Halobaculum sp. DT31]
MSEADTPLWRAALEPATASYGTRREQLVAALVVGTVAGVVAGTAMYSVRQSAVAPGWTSDALSGALVLVSGALVKLLCQHLRTSLLALATAIVVGLGVAGATAVAPYLLLDISTLGGLALLPELRDVITLAILGQIPLQFIGFLLAIVYDGATA